MDGFLAFFDPSKARGGSDSPDAGTKPLNLQSGSPGDAPMTVTHLLRRVKQAIAAELPAQIQVVGELSNVKRHSSGHLYFRLKDATSAIDATMFRSAAAKLKFTPQDGMEVILEGRVDVYDVRGQLQFYAEKMTPKGTGSLELAFRQLREKLESEGLFSAERKKPIPRFPRAIGLVTSPTGAAIQDIRRTLARRWPAAKVYLCPTRVQGDQAAAEIARAIALLDTHAKSLEIDTLILARGGGSMEDLWAFNEEPVARAIFAAKTPVIAGIGHEVDITIADLVADLRAPTPTGAAELAVPNREDLLAEILQRHRQLNRLIRQRLQWARSTLAAIGRSVVFKDPSAALRTHTKHVDELTLRLRAGIKQHLARQRRRLEQPLRELAKKHPARLYEQALARIERMDHRFKWALNAKAKRCNALLAAAETRLRAAHPKHRVQLAAQQIAALQRQLDSMNYRNVLKRGYSLTRDAKGHILRSVEQAPPGSRVETELASGSFRSVVEGLPASPPPKPAKKTLEDGPQGLLFD